MSLTSSLRKRARSLSRGIRTTFGREVSDDDDEDEQLGTKRQTRAKSPPLPTRAQLEEQDRQRNEQYLAKQQEENARLEQAALLEQLKTQSNDEVNAIIDNINSYLGFIDVNVDNEDPTIRFIVIMIVKSNKAGQNIYKKLSRSKLLLTAIANVIIKVARKSGTGILNIVQILLPIINRGAKQSGTFVAEKAKDAYDFASTAAYTIRNYLTSQQREGIAASPPRQDSYGDMTGNVYNYAATGLATGLPIFYNALYSVLTGIYNLLLPCVATGASMVASAASTGFKKLRTMCLTPEQAVGNAVNQVVPEGPDLECSICMDNAIVGQGAVLTNCGHRFHQNCIEEWFRRSGNRSCPYCRTNVTGLTQPQGGGGLKKYKSKTRTKSKSKSRSKSRRYISKPQKSRKARKRIRHASSRRK
jgi:hypothetical protein